jgi:pimeloyl-ACP methyl ester carboxylesterase
MKLAYLAAYGAFSLLSMFFIVTQTELVPFCLTNAEPGTFSEKTSSALTPRPADPAYQPPEDKFKAHAFTFKSGERTFFAQGKAVDAEATASKKPPLIVLLHGSEHDGRAMLDMWQYTGREKNVTLIAPNSLDGRRWNENVDGEPFLQAVIEEAAKSYSFDPDRIYLFGYSTGGMFALSMANRPNGTWRAAAAHAAKLDKKWIWQPKKPVPLQIYIGDGDNNFTVEEVRESAKNLTAAGHNTNLIIIKNHGHWFFKIGPKIAADTWRFFEKN